MNGPYDNVAALNAISRRYDALTQDVANAATPGYRRRRATDQAFSTALGNLQRVGATLTVDGTSGPMQQTGNPTDVAIDGRGYLQVKGEGDQVLLTRRGELRVANGKLALPGGLQLLDGGGSPIEVPEGELRVGVDGAVTVDGEVVGQLGFANASKLSPRGRGLYAAADATPLPSGRLVVGSREGSNVKLPEAMAELVMAQRLHAANLGAIRQLDTIDQRLLKIRA